MEPISKDLKTYSPTDQDKKVMDRKIKEELYNIIKDSWVKGTSFARSEKNEGIIIGMKIRPDVLVEAVNKIVSLMG